MALVYVKRTPGPRWWCSLLPDQFLGDYVHPPSSINAQIIPILVLFFLMLVVMMAVSVWRVRWKSLLYTSALFQAVFGADNGSTR